MKNIYPNQLVQRPETQALRNDDIRIGDLVSLKPVGSQAATVSKVIMVVPLHGSTTYTSEHVQSPKAPHLPAQVTRYRFRLQDVHRVIAA